MKKILFIIISLFICIGIVQAKNCEIISGDGKHIGDEIACGGEHFYIVEQNEEETRLMSKYNLMTNGSCELYLFNEPTDDPNEAESLTNEIIYNFPTRDYIYDSFIDYKRNEAGEYVGAKICYWGNYEEDIDYKQDSKALAFHGDVNHLEFPYEGLFPGINFMSFGNGNYYVQGKDLYNLISMPSSQLNESIDNDFFLNFEYGEETSEIAIFNNYKNYLKGQKIEVLKVDEYTLGELVELVETISGEEIDLDNFKDPTTWELFQGTDSDSTIISQHLVITDIKEKIPEKYKWIYGTTYWLKTISLGSEKIGATDFFDPGQLFITTLGQLCISEICVMPSVGLRPIVTVPTSIVYNPELDVDTNKDEPENENPNTGAFISYSILGILAASAIGFLITNRKKQLNKVV